MNGLREIVYFTDRDLGKQFPERLRAAGVMVENMMARETKASLAQRRPSPSIESHRPPTMAVI